MFVVDVDGRSHLPFPLRIWLANIWADRLFRFGLHKDSPAPRGGAPRAPGRMMIGELSAQGVEAREANATPARGLRLWVHRGRFRATHVAIRSTQRVGIRSLAGRDYPTRSSSQRVLARSRPAIILRSASHESENDSHPDESVKASHGQPKADIGHDGVG